MKYTKFIFILLLIIISIDVSAQRIQFNSKQSFVDSTRLNSAGDSLYHYQNGQIVKKEALVVGVSSVATDNTLLGSGTVLDSLKVNTTVIPTYNAIATNNLDVFTLEYTPSTFDYNTQLMNGEACIGTNAVNKIVFYANYFWVCQGGTGYPRQWTALADHAYVNFYIESALRTLQTDATTTRVTSSDFSQTSSIDISDTEFYIVINEDTIARLQTDSIFTVGNYIFEANQSVGPSTDNYVLTYDVNDNQISLEPTIDTSLLVKNTQLNDSLLNYVTLSTNQTITGLKTFTSDLDINAKIKLNDGNNNILIGDNVGDAITTGFYNIASGTSSLTNNTIGSNNLAYGVQSLQANISGNNNVAIGTQSLTTNSSGSNNIAVSYRSLYSNTVGNFNMAIGNEALRSNTAGNNNIAIGNSSLYNNTLGNYNIVYGSSALQSVNTGDNNLALGYRAGWFLSTGTSFLTSSNNSLFIGSFTKPLADTSLNEIIIGNNAIGNGSNTITLGDSNVVSLHTANYEFNIDQVVDAGTDNYVLTYDNTGGQISLEDVTTLIDTNIIATTKALNDSLASFTGGGTTSSINQETFISDGIQSSYTTALNLPTDVSNIIVTHNGLTLDDGLFTLTLPKTINLGYVPDAGSRITIMWFSDIVTVNNTGTGVYQQQFTSDGIDSSYTINNVLPSNSKDVIVLQNGVVLDNTFFTVLDSTVTLNFLPPADDKITVIYFTGYNSITGNITQTGGDVNFDNGTLFIDDSLNNVGIGTTSPLTTLHAYHPTNNTVGYFESGDSGVNITFKDNNSSNRAFVGATGDRLYLGHINNGEQVVVEANGNVGIGTTSPNARLEIKSDGSADAGAEIRLQHANNNSTDVVSTVNFANNIGSVAMIQGGTTGANNTGYISFFTDNLGTSSEKVRIIGNGNVGIGTTSPAALLDVNGTFNSSGVVSGAGLRSNNIGSASTSGTGWFKIAKVDSRGGGVITLSFTGGSYIPVTYVIKYYKDWVSNTTLKLEKYGTSDHITDVRFIRDDSDSKYYIEFLTGSNNLSFQVYHDWTLGYNASTTMYTGALSAGAASGTTTSSLPFVNYGTSTHSQHVSSTLGIGTTSPDEKLVVRGNGARIKIETASSPSVYKAYIESNYNASNTFNIVDGFTHRFGAKALVGTSDTYINGYNNVYIATGTTGNTSASNIRLFVTNGGNVGIGTTSPSYKLHVNGSVAGVGGYVNLSDEFYKKNVYDINYGINELKQLRPVRFNWINPDYGTRTNLGFIAQEVELVMPEVVITANDGVKSMASTDLIPVLTKAVQEQQDQIDQLQQQIQLLIAEINALKNN